MKCRPCGRQHEGLRQLHELGELPSMKCRPCGRQHASTRWPSTTASSSVNEVPSLRTATRLLVGQAFSLEISLPLRVVWSCVRFPR